MRLRTVLLLFIAIGLAGGTAVLARAWLAAQRAQEIAEAAPLALPTPAKSVLVARNDIKRGQILKPEDMMWQPWPEGGVDKNYVVLGSKTPESFAGWVARNPVSAGEPITESKIISPSNRGFLAAVLRPGMRAISVPVTITSGISGFIFPGDQVDLMITFQVPNSGGSSGYEHKAAETVLHNVRVIAIDQRLESKAGEAVVAHTATLEVTPKQTEVIALASEIGKMSLSLRSLVATSGEAAADGNQATASEGGQLADSSNGVPDPTFTIDSEISPLLPKSLHGNDNSDSGTITILRGGGKGADSIASPAASRGS
ncbi:MAG: Flp pilus assembly protein CpaB [Alphaproteobacteria bacterium]|nr:Flp pilus assembly protein CpaB [Alphaproteobacteria bacterium]